MKFKNRVFFNAVNYQSSVISKSQQTTIKLLTVDSCLLSVVILSYNDIYNFLRNDDDFLDALVGDPFCCFW